MVNAVADAKGGDPVPVQVKFQLKSRPDVAQPLDVDIVIVPISGSVDRVVGTVEGEDGLDIVDGGQIPAADRPAEGVSIAHTIRVLPKRDGIFTLSAVLTVDSAGQSNRETYSIPIIAGAGMPDLPAKPATPPLGRVAGHRRQAVRLDALTAPRRRFSRPERPYDRIGRGVTGNPVGGPYDLYRAPRPVLCQTHSPSGRAPIRPRPCRGRRPRWCGPTRGYGGRVRDPVAPAAARPSARAAAAYRQLESRHGDAAAPDQRPVRDHRSRAARHRRVDAPHGGRSARARPRGARAELRAPAGHSRSHQGRRAHGGRGGCHPAPSIPPASACSATTRPRSSVSASICCCPTIAADETIPEALQRLAASAGDTALDLAARELWARRKERRHVPGGDRRQQGAAVAARDVRAVPAGRHRATRVRAGDARERGALPAAGRPRARGDRGAGCRYRALRGRQRQGREALRPGARAAARARARSS